MDKTNTNTKDLDPTISHETANQLIAKKGILQVETGTQEVLIFLNDGSQIMAWYSINEEMSYTLTEKESVGHSLKI